MRFNKIVYVRYFPLTKAIYTDLYFEELIQNNINVEYIDLTSLFFPDKITLDDFNFSGTIKINSYKGLKEYLKDQNKADTLYVSIMTFEGRVLRLFRLFTKLDLTLGVFARGVFPNSAQANNRRKIARILKVFNWPRLKEFARNKIAILTKKLGFIKPYDYIFKAGEFGHWGLGLGSEIDCENAKIIKVNTVDYDRFLSHKEFPPVGSEEQYIVFLDQYLPYHPDASYLKIRTVEAEPYFKEVNEFFDKLELATGKKVIIAAHPKAEKYKEFNPFNGREIFINKSNDLVKNASLVLTHATTAVCFPICYQKKLVLLMSDYLNNVLPEFLTVAKSLVNACDATLIAIDNLIEIKIPQEINLEKYNDFKYKYLTSAESENQLSRDIYINFLKNSSIVA